MSLRSNKARRVRFVACLTLLSMLALASCSHVEPWRAEGTEAQVGDKVWNFVHPWYDTDWNGWAKAAYWIGPGH